MKIIKNENIMRYTFLFSILIMTVMMTGNVSMENLFYNVNTSNRTVIVTKIVDGDTILISPYDDMLGFVGINAPELGRNGSYEAVDYVAKRIMYKTIYIDIDNKRPKDINGRILAVVYIDGENLNKELLCKRYAEIELISPSEFDPNNWKLSCSDNVSTSLPISLPSPLKNESLKDENVKDSPLKNESLKEDIITLDENVKEIDITEDTNEIDLLEKENKENSIKSSPGFELIIIVIALIYAFRRINKNG